MPGAIVYTADGCDPLPVLATNCDGYPGRLTCWELTTDELETIQQTGRIWMHTLGAAVIPVSLSIDDPRETE